MFKEFKEFALKGNVLDLAIGLILGAGFGKVVTSFVDHVLMPPAGLLLGGVDFTNLFVSLSGVSYPTLEQAKAAGAPVIAYGLFISTLIDFLLVAFMVFLIVRAVNRMRRNAEATTKPCPRCLSTIPLAATRCPSCTSDLQAA